MILKKYRFNIYQVNQKTKEVELRIECVTGPMSKKEYNQVIKRKLKEFENSVIERIG